MPSCTGLKIRLALHGCTNRPFFHIIVTESRFKRNGRHLEQLGSFDPMPNYNNEKLASLNVKRIKYWLGVGATPTNLVSKILGLAGLLPVHPRTYLEARRHREGLLQETAVSESEEA